MELGIKRGKQFRGCLPLAFPLAALRLHKAQPSEYEHLLERVQATATLKLLNDRERNAFLGHEPGHLKLKNSDKDGSCRGDASHGRVFDRGAFAGVQRNSSYAPRLGLIQPGRLNQRSEKGYRRESSTSLEATSSSSVGVVRIRCLPIARIPIPMRYIKYREV